MTYAHSKTYNLVLVLFLLIFSCFGLFYSAKDVSLVFSGIKTEGVVSDSYCVTTCKNRIVNISYIDSSGNGHVITRINELNSSFYKKGEKVTVYFDKDNPKHAIDFSYYIFIWPMIMLIITGILLVALKSLSVSRHS